MIGRFSLFTACISDIYWMLQKIEREEMASYQLKAPHAQCLVAMSRRAGGVTAAQLCELCEKDKASISRTVSELVARGLVLREGGNGYRAALRLTEEGRQIAGEVNRKVTRAVVRAGEGLTDADREVLYASLERIATNLEKLSEEGLGI